MEWRYFPQSYAKNVVVKDLEFPRLSDLEVKRKRSGVNEDKKQGIELVSGAKRIKMIYEGDQISNYFERVATIRGKHESPCVKSDEDKNVSSPDSREFATSHGPASKEKVVTVAVIHGQEIEERAHVPPGNPSGTIAVSDADQNDVFEAPLDNGIPPVCSEITMSNGRGPIDAQIKRSISDDTANHEDQKSQSQLDQVNIPGNVASLSNTSNIAAIQIAPPEDMPPREFSQDSEPPDLDVLLQRCNEILRNNAAVPDYGSSVPAIDARTVSNHDYQGYPRERSFHQDPEAFYPVEYVPHEGHARRYTTSATIVSKGPLRHAIREPPGYSIQQRGKTIDESNHGDFRLVPETYFTEYVNGPGNANGKEEFHHMNIANILRQYRWFKCMAAQGNSLEYLWNMDRITTHPIW